MADPVNITEFGKEANEEEFTGRSNYNVHINIAFASGFRGIMLMW